MTRETILAYVERRIAKGDSDIAILSGVHRTFPRSQTHINYIERVRRSFLRSRPALAEWLASPPAREKGTK